MDAAFRTGPIPVFPPLARRPPHQGGWPCRPLATNRGCPAEGVPYQIVQAHFETFRAQAASLRDGEGLPRFVEQEFRDFLRCGWLAGGFARFRCYDRYPAGMATRSPTRTSRVTRASTRSSTRASSLEIVRSICRPSTASAGTTRSLLVPETAHRCVRPWLPVRRAETAAPVSARPATDVATIHDAACWMPVTRWPRVPLVLALLAQPPARSRPLIPRQAGRDWRHLRIAPALPSAISASVLERGPAAR